MSSIILCFFFSFVWHVNWVLGRGRTLKYAWYHKKTHTGLKYVVNKILGTSWTSSAGSWLRPPPEPSWRDAVNYSATGGVFRPEPAQQLHGSLTGHGHSFIIQGGRRAEKNSRKRKIKARKNPLFFWGKSVKVSVHHRRFEGLKVWTFGARSFLHDLKPIS